MPSPYEHAPFGAFVGSAFIATNAVAVHCGGFHEMSRRRLERYAKRLGPRRASIACAVVVSGVVVFGVAMGGEVVLDSVPRRAAARVAVRVVTQLYLAPPPGLQAEGMEA